MNILISIFNINIIDKNYIYISFLIWFIENFNFNYYI